MDVVRAVGWVRLATGAALVAAPGRVTRSWMHAAADLPGGRLAARSLGAREAALAVALLAAPRGPARRGWLLAGAAADLGDVAGTLGSLRRLPLGTGAAATLVLGTVAAVVQLHAAAQAAEGTAA